MVSLNMFDIENGVLFISDQLVLSKGSLDLLVTLSEDTSPVFHSIEPLSAITVTVWKF